MQRACQQKRLAKGDPPQTFSNQHAPAPFANSCVVGNAEVIQREPSWRSTSGLPVIQAQSRNTPLTLLQGRDGPILFAKSYLNKRDKAGRYVAVFRPLL